MNSKRKLNKVNIYINYKTFFIFWIKRPLVLSWFWNGIPLFSIPTKKKTTNCSPPHPVRDKIQRSWVEISANYWKQQWDKKNEQYGQQCWLQRCTKGEGDWLAKYLPGFSGNNIQWLICFPLLPCFSQPQVMPLSTEARAPYFCPPSNAVPGIW